MTIEHSTINISPEIVIVQCSIVISLNKRTSSILPPAAFHTSRQRRNHEIRIDANPHRRGHGYVGHVSSGSCVRERTGGPDRSGRPGTAAADGGRGFYERPGAQRYSG